MLHTGHRFGTTRVGYVDELLEEDAMLLVIPVAEDDCVFLVIFVHFLWRVDDHGCTETVNILALSIECVRTICQRCKF